MIDPRYGDDDTSWAYHARRRLMEDEPMISEFDEKRLKQQLHMAKTAKKSAPKKAAPGASTLSRIASGKVLEFAYKNKKGEKKIRKVLPTGEMKFCARTGNWLVIGIDQRKKETRSFKLSKMRFLD